ncbi:hypothetical protein AAFF_G00074180 [Aldrovandia affinis]|uniref:KN motif and ankyrin repeat domain-containing protein n=1 Tax=Aldrovandia affinis TaxID=143900 RepID=A0AAD7RYH3_9TELE|nr:hypothetical protein AAFF_G00074180 [Aldrovandia affinis]
MMDKKNANGFSSKATESGSQRKQLPYSVETPYGFHLDLDFLKYVDDIEKGNTIKRVHIQRRNKGPKFSTLPRNFSLPGHASRAAPKDSWASTCTLGPRPKSRVMEVQQIFEFRACESGPSGQPRAPGVIHKSTREDGGVRVFDEQPLGIHVRPHLLRASSMPVTVLQRKTSESVEDKGAQVAGDSCRVNGSSGSASSEVVGRWCIASQDQAGLHQQFATARHRIQELEEQVRTIPELQAEICALREEKEQLLLKLNSQPPVITEVSMQHAGYEGTDDQVQSPESLDASVVEDAAPSIVQQVTDQQSITEQQESEEQENMQMSSVSENLTIKVLQEKLLALEGKFSDANKELEKTNVLLREQIEENKLKEERIKQLTEEADVCGKVENAEVDRETCDLGDIKQSSGPILTCDASLRKLWKWRVRQAVEEPCSAIQEEPAKKVGESEGSMEPVSLQASECTTSDGAEEVGPQVEPARQPCQSDKEQEPDQQGPSEPASSNAAIGQYVNKIQGLLNEQWACLGSGNPEVTTTIKQPASRFSSIQTQLVSSLNALSAFYSSPGQKGGASRQAGLKSIMKKNDSADKPGNGGAKKNLKFVGVNGGYETTSSEDSSGEDDVEEDSSEPEEKGEGAGHTAALDVVAPDTEAPDAAAPDTAAPDASGGPQEEQSGRETVDEGFMAACHFIKDRQAELATPDKELRESLMVLYQEWFRVSSQKESLVDTVTLHLKEVGAATPTLLRFIVNLADGNGNTALHYSVSHSNFPIVKLLLDTGLCEVDNENKAGYTAIMLASLTAADGPEDMEVALQLLKQGNVNARASQAGQTALMLAVSHGRTAMVRLLLSCEADLNVQDHDGSTALMCACEHGHTEITRLLLERSDCDLSLTDREGHSALAVATQASHSEIVDLLKAYPGDGASDAPQPL